MFLICGEALFDVFLEEDIPANARTVPLTARVGGSPFNVAVGLARLGRRSTLFTGVSTDFFGERLVSVLKDEGVLTHLLRRKPAPTTLGFVERDTNGLPSYAFYGEGAADRSLVFEDINFDLEDVRCLHVGSYSIVAPSTADVLEELVRRESGKRIISLDPNIRPTVEPDLAVWRERVNQLVKWTDVIKASDEDLAWLYPDTDHQEILTAWINAGVKLVVMTRGQQGALLTSSKGRAYVTAPQVKVVDTVGAGDTFQAVLLDQLVKLEQESNEDWHQLLNESVLQEMGSYAATAAAITCSWPGADLPTRSDLDQFLLSANANFHSKGQ